MEDSLKKRYSIKLLANMVNGLINIVIVALVPKALGPIAYGQFTFIQNFFIQVIGFFDAGTSIAFFTKLSARPHREELLKFYFLYAFVVLLIVVAGIITLDISGYSSTMLPAVPLTYAYMGIAFGFLTWMTQIFIKISDANALTVSVEVIKILHKLFTLILLWYVVSLSAFGLKYYFYFHYAALLSFLIIISLLFFKKNIFKTSVIFLKIRYAKISLEFLHFSSPLFVVSIVSLAVGLGDIWLLQKFGGSEQTAFYGLAYSIAAMCFLFTGAMTPIITREFSKSYEAKDLKQMKHLFERYIPMLYGIAAYFSIFIAFQSENLLMIFTDERFQNAYLVLMIIAFYPIHQTYGQLSGSVFYATGQTKKMRNISLVIQPIGALFSFLLLYMFELGAQGLAWKMIVIQLIGVNIQLFYNARFLDLKLKKFVMHQIYTILFFLFLGWLGAQTFFFVENAILNFFLSGIIYTLLVIIATYFFPQVFSVSREELMQYVHKVINVVKK